jgi:DNA-binding CsgD family transcriptional regulator
MHNQATQHKHAYREDTVYGYKLEPGDTLKASDLCATATGWSACDVTHAGFILTAAWLEKVTWIRPYDPSAVTIHVAAAEDAYRITAVLEALGYTVTRDYQDGAAAERGQLTDASARLARRHKLTTREHGILDLLLAGQDNAQIAATLELSRATVKWHMRNIFDKTGATSRENLLRLALQLPTV